MSYIQSILYTVIVVVIIIVVVVVSKFTWDRLVGP